MRSAHAKMDLSDVALHSNLECYFYVLAGELLMSARFETICYMITHRQISSYGISRKEGIVSISSTYWGRLLSIIMAKQDAANDLFIDPFLRTLFEGLCTTICHNPSLAILSCCWEFPIKQTTF